MCQRTMLWNYLCSDDILKSKRKCKLIQSHFFLKTLIVLESEDIDWTFENVTKLVMILTAQKRNSIFFISSFQLYSISQIANAYLKFIYLHSWYGWFQKQKYNIISCISDRVLWNIEVLKIPNMLQLEILNLI